MVEALSCSCAALWTMSAVRLPRTRGRHLSVWIVLIRNYQGQSARERFADQACLLLSRSDLPSFDRLQPPVRRLLQATPGVFVKASMETSLRRTRLALRPELGVTSSPAADHNPSIDGFPRTAGTHARIDTLILYTRLY